MKKFLLTILVVALLAGILVFAVPVSAGTSGPLKGANSGNIGNLVKDDEENLTNVNEMPVVESNNTRLLVVLSSKYGSIDELNNPAKIGLRSVAEIPWLQTALNSYGKESFPVLIPESDTYHALLRGVIDAVLVTTHPFSCLQTGIESGEFQLLPWSEEAVTAVVEAYPNVVIPARLPANTYAGQTDAILGYAYHPPITLTENFTLASDMKFSNTGFIIGADNITLDLNGHTLTGNYAPFPDSPEQYTAGVQIDGHTGVTVKNGTIRGFNWGITLSNSDYNCIEGIAAIDNTARGLALYGSENNLIEGVVATGNTYDGMIVSYSCNNVIKSVVSSDNGWWGIEITSGSDDNQVLNSTFANNGNIQAAGGVIIVGSNGNLVKGCTSNRNDTVGVGVVGRRPPEPGIPVPVIGNIVRDSTITNNNLMGIRLAIADNTSIIGNTIGNNDFMGISLEIADENSIIDNIISNNEPAGIELSNSDGNILIGNTIDGNRAAGIVVTTQADDNEIRDNRIGSGGNGIRIGASPIDPVGSPPANNHVIGNTIEANGRFGVLITTGAHDNEIGNNTIKGNGLIGIFVGATPPPPPLLQPPVPPEEPPLPSADPENNLIKGNKLSHNTTYDIQDVTIGDGSLGTANYYEDNKGKTSDPAGLVK